LSQTVKTDHFFQILEHFQTVWMY